MLATICCSVGFTVPVSRRPARHARHKQLRMADSNTAAAHATLVLVRHGQSEWNLANRFTGWVDVDLTERGITEAREAGRLLASEGLQIDECFSSTLRRSIDPHSLPVALRPGSVLGAADQGCAAQRAALRSAYGPQQARAREAVRSRASAGVAA